MLMLCLEWWMYEIGGFLAGVISEVELGAQSIVYELATIAYMVTPLPVHFPHNQDCSFTLVLLCFVMAFCQDLAIAPL